MSIGSVVFAGITSVTDRPTDRQTDRPRYSVAASTYVVLRCGLIIHTPMFVVLSS